MTTLEVLRKLYRQRFLAAREWKENGGKVVGYIGPDVPEEMLLAAGFFPLRITGDPSGSTALADRYMEPVFDPMVRSIFNRLLDGTYAFLDHLVIANSADALVRLFYYLREVKRIEPDLAIPDFCFLDILHTRFRTSALYNRDRFREFERRLVSWSGREISDDAYAEAIAVCNENRRLLQEVALLRVAEPPRVSGVDALQIIGAAMFTVKEEHNKLLRRFLSEANELPKRSGARLFLDGTSVDSVQFYEIVESCGCTVVAETTDWGNRYFDGLVNETDSPFDAIVDRYHLRAPCPSKASVSARVEYCVRKALEARAQGVIFFILESDDAPSWDYPEQRKALEQRGIPTLCVDTQPYALSDFEGLKSRIQSFLGRIGSGQDD